MTLTAGTRLGPYEIVAPLGAGGMGEVYRAKDTRLGREVAVKVLPQHLSANADIRARFEREAKTISSLNHPHICTLFDVGREGDVDFLVMELVDGETLAQRIARVGALPTPDVLKFGAQIADALDRAHRAGVVHRDLKPGNIMLTKAGAKLMDFGLARATEASGPASASGVTMAALTVTATHASPLTAEGTLVGTFQYMAPEQLEGQEADARADLWALGCVLYEMATGKRAFDGRSQASLIGAIMTTEPAPVSQVAPLAPAGLDRLVRTCLTKDPDERVRTAHDIRLQLEGIAEGASVSGVAVAVPRRKARGAWLPWAVAGLAIVGAAVWSWTRPRDLEPIRAIIDMPAGLSMTGYGTGIALSPDGKTLAFVAGDSTSLGLWTRPLGSTEPTRLRSVQSVMTYGIFWSPDNRALGYFDVKTQKLMKAPLDGSAPVPLCEAKSARGGTWSRKGVIVFASELEGPLSRVSDSGGAVSPATTLDPARHEVGHRFPSFLPDGDHFLFTALPAGPGGFNTFVGSLSSKKVTLVLTAANAPVYAAPGYLVFAREGHIVAQRFDVRALEVEGDPVVVADAPPTTDADAEPVATASRTGHLAFLRSGVTRTALRWLDRTGDVGAPPALPAGAWVVRAVSADARRAIVQSGQDLWLADLTRGIPTRFAEVHSIDATAAFSPDGGAVAYTSQQSGRMEVYIANTDGSGAPRRIASVETQFKYIMEWTPDGQSILLQSVDPTTAADIWILPASGHGQPTPFLRTPYFETSPTVSPDGHWIAYTSNESGSNEIYVQSFPAPGHKVRVTGGGGQLPVWALGGRELQYIRDDKCMAVSIQPGAAMEPGAEHALYTFPKHILSGATTRDGARSLVGVSLGDPHWDVQLCVNWAAGLAR